MDINTAITKCFNYCYNTEKNLEKESVFSEYQKSIPSDFIYHFPPSIIWKITSACNLRCKHCFYYTNDGVFNTQNDMTKEEALNLAKYLVEDLNILSVLFTGGEALLSEYFFDLLEYFKSKNVCISLLTNGTLIDEEKADKILSLLNPKYDNIQISLDGPNSETHDSIRGKGNFARALNGIKILSNKGFPPSIACTLTSENVEYLELFSNLLNEYRISELRLNRYKVFSKEQEYLVPNLDRLFINIAKLIDKNVKFSKNIFNAYDFLKYDIGKNLFKELSIPENYKCNKLCHNHNKMFISADAKIYLCTSSETAGLCLGDLRKESFEDIWAKRYQNPLFQKREILICQKCEYKYWCNSGCPLMSYLANQNISTPPKECLYQYELEKNNA